jgi:AbrB family looped-hinge helix DNA binding protein
MAAAKLHKRNRPHTAEMRQKGVVTIPQDVRAELGLEVGDQFFVRIEDGNVVLVPARLVPADQAWFWTPEWQGAEREAADELARGEGEFFEDGAEFLKDLADRAGANVRDLR